VEWNPDVEAGGQLGNWCELAGEPGVVHAVFVRSGAVAGVGWLELEFWTRSRAVTVAEVRSTISGPALDIALCSDLVYLRRDVELTLAKGEPSAGLVWALGRAGRAALARGLLDPAPLSADEAVRLGLAQRVLDDGESPAVTDAASVVALTTARDLMRSSVGARTEIELASFRLLFASGDPGEGARAFFDGRSPDFKPR
jgi:enoyl-CoA hydratase/carnithine racemase